MTSRDQQIKDKLAQRFSPTIQICLNTDNNTFSFPNLSFYEVLRIRDQILSSKEKSIDIFAGDKKGLLTIVDGKFELSFP